AHFARFVKMPSHSQNCLYGNLVNPFSGLNRVCNVPRMSAHNVLDSRPDPVSIVLCHNSQSRGEPDCLTIATSSSARYLVVADRRNAPDNPNGYGSSAVGSDPSSHTEQSPKPGR